MSDYRRAIVPGGTFFLTLVTYRRTPLFSESENVFRLRVAVAQMLTERPFEIIGRLSYRSIFIFFGDCRQTIQIIPSEFLG